MSRRARITGEPTKRSFTYLQYPGTIAAKGVASVYNVSMLREAREKIAYTLQQCIRLRVNENFRNKVLGSILDQSLA